ncbi:hypothetical protein L1987_15326 [Smallanthus sonchifolius]|uniref:Uncharacterized protein n=1 Tax=Smallanthus sonchifolius TaxID=185202 RepID=A0ACB9J564_9ASTR|nr:hypothetical protein L1987_15326 [Smallanthus sonchifolius]
MKQKHSFWHHRPFDFDYLGIAVILDAANGAGFVDPKWSLEQSRRNFHSGAIKKVGERKDEYTEVDVDVDGVHEEWSPFLYHTSFFGETLY